MWKAREDSACWQGLLRLRSESAVMARSARRHAAVSEGQHRRLRASRRGSWERGWRRYDGVQKTDRSRWVRLRQSLGRIWRAWGLQGRAVVTSQSAVSRQALQTRFVTPAGCATWLSISCSTSGGRSEKVVIG